jgi:hypothetical protein
LIRFDLTNKQKRILILEDIGMWLWLSIIILNTGIFGK